MKPDAEGRQQRDRQPEVSIHHSDLADPKPLVELSEEQRRVLDCLQTAGTGLTLRQLETGTAGSAPVIQAALDGLIERDLVARLNTLIPSYAYRYPGIRVYAE